MYRRNNFDYSRVQTVNTSHSLSLEPHVTPHHVFDELRVNNFMKAVPEKRTIPDIDVEEAEMIAKYGQKVDVDPQRMLEKLLKVTIKVVQKDTAGNVLRDPQSGKILYNKKTIQSVFDGSGGVSDLMRTFEHWKTLYRGQRVDVPQDIDIRTQVDSVEQYLDLVEEEKEDELKTVIDEVQKVSDQYEHKHGDEPEPIVEPPAEADGYERYKRFIAAIRNYTNSIEELVDLQEVYEFLHLMNQNVLKKPPDDQVELTNYIDNLIDDIDQLIKLMKKIQDDLEDEDEEFLAQVQKFREYLTKTKPQIEEELTNIEREYYNRISEDQAKKMIKGSLSNIKRFKNQQKRHSKFKITESSNLQKIEHDILFRWCVLIRHYAQQFDDDKELTKDALIRFYNKKFTKKKQKFKMGKFMAEFEANIPELKEWLRRRGPEDISDEPEVKGDDDDGIDLFDSYLIDHDIDLPETSIIDYEWYENLSQSKQEAVKKGLVKFVLNEKLNPKGHDTFLGRITEKKLNAVSVLYLMKEDGAYIVQRGDNHYVFAGYKEESTITEV